MQCWQWGEAAASDVVISSARVGEGIVGNATGWHAALN